MAVSAATTPVTGGAPGMAGGAIELGLRAPGLKKHQSRRPAPCTLGPLAAGTFPGPAFSVGERWAYGAASEGPDLDDGGSRVGASFRRAVRRRARPSLRGVRASSMPCQIRHPGISGKGLADSILFVYPEIDMPDTGSGDGPEFPALFASLAAAAALSSGDDPPKWVKRWAAASVAPDSAQWLSRRVLQTEKLMGQGQGRGDGPGELTSEGTMSPSAEATRKDPERHMRRDRC